MTQLSTPVDFAQQLSQLKVVVLAFEPNLSQLQTQLERFKKSCPRQPIIVFCNHGEVQAYAEQQGVEAKLGLGPRPEAHNYWLQVLTAYGYRGEPLAFVHQACEPVDNWAPRLLSELTVAAGRAPVMALSPLAASHAVHRATPNRPKQAGLGAEAVDQWLADYSDGESYDLPLLPPAAALFVGDQWPSVLAQAAADAELFLLAKSHGSLLGSSQVYMDDCALPHDLFKTGHINPIYIKAVVDAHPLASLRYALAELIARGEQPPKIQPLLPARLYLSHGWGGGLRRWVEDAVAADSQHRCLVLKPIGTWDAFGQSIGLYHSAEPSAPIRTWLLGEAIAATAVFHHQYSQILAEIIADYQIEDLVVSSLIGQSLDALRTGLPTTLVLHDFFPYCPALVASDKEACHSCDSAKQKDCKANNEHHRFFNNVEPLVWDQLRPNYAALLLQDSIKMVAPCQSVAERYRALIPSLAEKTISIIGHGLGDEAAADFANSRTQIRPAKAEGGKRKIIVLGSMAKIKGADILSAAAPELIKNWDIVLLGTGESGQAFAGKPGFTVREQYQKHELPSLIAEVNPDVGLLLSIVPETFSYTLSELWAAAVPVVACNIGAFADRVKPGSNGWLIEANSAALQHQLAELHRAPEQLERVRNQLYQSPIPSATDMMGEYNALWPERAAPLERYHLGRRYFYNPYLNNNMDKRDSGLYIDNQSTYKQVLREFINYTQAKVSGSPRLPGVVRRPLAWLLRKLVGL